jgi:hypothetical protein
MTITASDFAPSLKEIVVNSIEDATYKNFPLYALVKKDEKFGGESKRVSVGYEDVNGGGGTFSAAQTAAAAGGSKLKGFSVTHGNDFSLARIPGDLIRKSEGNTNAIAEASSYEIKRAMRSMARSHNHKMWRTGYGEIGAINTVSGSTFKMVNADEIVFIQVGMLLHFSSAISGAALRSATALTVTAVDEDNNLVTCGATMASVGAVNNDIVFRAGDRENDASTDKLVLTGTGGWIPQTAPVTGGSDSFFSVDRSAHPNRLAGNRWAATTTPPEVVVLQAVHRVSRRGGELTHLFVPPAFFRALVEQLHGRHQIVEVMATEKIGFKAIEVIGTEGSVVVMQDIMIPPDRIFGLNIDDWELCSAGPAVRLADEDDLKLSRLSDADTYEIRFVFHGNLICRNPINQITISITPYT